MAVIDPKFDESGFEPWLATESPIVQELARKVRPNRMYRLASGQYAYVLTWREDGTVEMLVDPLFNKGLMYCHSAIVPVDEPVECDVPEGGEIVGSHWRAVPEDPR